jgi:hypothetical protein
LRIYTVYVVKDAKRTHLEFLLDSEPKDFLV